MTAETVSLLIPVHNAAPYLEATIRSALSQTYPNVEIIAVDDGSTDGSSDILSQFDADIIWWRQPNAGGCISRNRLMSRAQGKWLQFLDADDILRPDKIRHQMALATNSGDVDFDVVLDSMWVFDHRPEPNDAWLFRMTEPDWWAALIRTEIPYTSAALWRREAIEAVGGWDERLPSNQEYDLYFRLLAAGRKFIYDEACLTYFRLPKEKAAPKRDPRRSLLIRAEFLNRIEEHLGDRKNDYGLALSESRLELARNLWRADRAAAVSLASRLSRLSFVHGGTETAPLHYRLVLSVLGFEYAEIIAERLRGRK